jgi:SAM-dependent methyltransferase
VTSDWSRFRVEAITPQTFIKRNLIHVDLLRAALRRARGSVLEIGAGSGAQSALLSRLGPRVVTVDNDARILAIARHNLRRYGRDVRPILGDAFALPFRASTFGVAMSQGLLEHFTDNEIAKLLNEQLRVARSVVFSVPSHNYPRQDVGDERLMPPLRWEEIVRHAVDHRYRVRVSSYTLDLEAAKYSLRRRRWLGSFSVLVTVDPIP